MTLTLEPIVWIGPAQDPAHEVECNSLSAIVHHGRDDASTQPLASTLTLELVGDLPAAAVMGASVALGARVIGETLTYLRFSGEITDIGIGWDSVDVPRPRIIATGDLGRMGRRMVGDVPWPAELDGDRVNRILGLAGFPPFPSTLSDRGTVQVLARDVDRRSALELAQETAGDGMGMVWQDRSGRILYADAIHRRGSVVTYEFNACDIGIGLDWQLSPEGLTNEVFLGYGPVPDGGEQAVIHGLDQGSIDERGTYAERISTQLATAGDAQRRVDELIARQADPAWVLGGLEVNLAALTPEETLGVIGLEVHSLVSVTGLPAGSPATSALLWVEGWRETIEALEDGTISWILAYATSDYCRTAAPPRWDDLPADATWDAIDPARTWNGAVCMPPVASRGRWDDVAASLRWATIQPPTTAWDNWPY